MEKSRSENNLETFREYDKVSCVDDDRNSFEKICYTVRGIDENEKKYICSYRDGNHERQEKRFSPCDLVPFSEIEKQCDGFTDDMLKIVQP